MITCSVCGAVNEAEAAFCGVCGSRLGADVPGSEPGASSGTLSGGMDSAAPVAAPADEDDVVPTRSARKATATSPDPADPITQVVPTPVSLGSAAGEPADDGKITCAVCGTRNDPDREFCRKCASPLHPSGPVDPNAGWPRKAALTFVLSAVVGVSVVLGGAALLQGPTAIAAAPVAIVGPNGDHVDVALAPAAPVPLPALPATSTIQLASFKQAQASSPPGGLVQPPWWNATVPRVPAVTQFDGGPLQAVNCVMAAGAMLARLGYGIVTTGSQLRALQDDQGGATNYTDLQQAVQRGWGAKFFRGDLTSLQFRALLWAGAGVEIGILYGALPVADRLQENFTGNHSIYIDAFRPNGPDGPAAYYVMDPIGHTWAGYRGEWLPAQDIEAAAKAHSAGLISATWAFAGGVVPADHRVLPPDAYPSDAPPPPTQAPGKSGQPSGSGGPVVDPMPVGDLPVVDGDPPTGDPPPDTPKFPGLNFVSNVSTMDAGVALPYCSVLPAPAGCPQGILGVIDGTKVGATAPPDFQVQLLYADPIAPGTYQIVFESPPDSTGDFYFWNTSGGALQQATVDAGYIGGQAVSVATITVDPTANYSFVASATGDGLRTVSSVGTVTVSQ